MISDKLLSNAVNAKIAAGGLTELEIAQLSGAQPALDSSIPKVNLIADLPDAAANTGRMIYVIAEEEYYYSTGEEWSTDYSSEIVLRYEGYGWGYNGQGRLGDGTTTNRSSGPVNSIIGDINWSQLSAGFMSRHTLGLASDGIAYAWGQGNYGQLGNGAAIFSISPVTVVGITNWSQVSAGSNAVNGAGGHSLGLTSDGIAYAWGINTNGRLGDGTVTSRTSPVTVVGGITNWSQVSAGFGHSLGLTSAGIAYGWGANEFGESGDGTRTSRLSPVTVVGGITNWSRLSAGNIASLGITTTGQAYGWGYGEYFNGGGRLGNGTTSNFSSPVAVLGPSNWTDIVIGNHHGLGIITQAKTL